MHSSDFNAHNDMVRTVPVPRYIAPSSTPRKLSALQRAHIAVLCTVVGACGSAAAVLCFMVIDQLVTLLVR